MGLLQGKDIINFVVLHNFDEEMLFDISSMGLETFAGCVHMAVSYTEELGNLCFCWGGSLYFLSSHLCA